MGLDFTEFLDFLTLLAVKANKTFNAIHLEGEDQMEKKQKNNIQGSESKEKLVEEQKDDNEEKRNFGDENLENDVIDSNPQTIIKMLQFMNIMKDR